MDSKCYAGFDVNQVEVANDAPFVTVLNTLKPIWLNLNLLDHL